MLSGLLACSGPGAAEAIALSGRIALASFAITFLCFLLALLLPVLRRRVGWGGVAALFACTLFHPGLVFGTLRGDCGFTARWASLLFLPLLAGLCAYLLRRRRASAQPSVPPSGP
jgi:hypothetical protein